MLLFRKNDYVLLLLKENLSNYLIMIGDVVDIKVQFYAK